ncbi:YjgN family protein [Ramlibacter sp. AN1133]|uniref:YjgN family protein n=1 Tax=Ramlibacter sp. AN1133 TaxID=3133429 RepID=UPI0030BA8A6C
MADDNGTPGQRPGIDKHAVEFTGSGGEYFRVWIVNVLLSVVTLGFYTPFARRRTAQYFYGHTLVASSPLEFTAQQRKMVIGFVLLVALYAAFKTASQTGQDTVVALMTFGGAALAPYFWGSAMRFRLNATRWRGVRLQFTAGWGEVYRASWPLFAMALAWTAAMLLAGALVPEGLSPATRRAASVPVLLATSAAAVAVSVWCLMRLEYNYKSLLVLRGRIGGQPGRWKPVFGDFVRIWLATLGVFLLTLLVIAALVAAALGGSFAILPKLRGMGFLAILVAIAIGIGTVLLLFLASAPARAYREARIFQLVWNNIGVSQVARFRCRLQARRYVGLRIRNVLLTILSLGFFRPFAVVSEYRMKSESVTLHVKGGLHQLAGQLAREEQGLGDAIADAVGLGLVG